MGGGLTQAINLLEGLDIGLPDKMTVLAFLQSEGINEVDADKAFKVAVRDNSRKFSVSISDALSTLLEIPHVTPAEAGDILISKGIDPNAVEQALNSIDLDQLDNIDGQPNSMLSPYMQDPDAMRQQNEEKISDVDPEILQGLLSYVKENPGVDPSQIEEFLASHNIDSNVARSIIRMIHLARDYPAQKEAASLGYEPNTYANEIEIDAPSLAKILIDEQGMKPSAALNALTQNGIPQDEAVRAIREVHNVGGPDRPEGDLSGVMGPGTEEGPTEPPADMGGGPAVNNVGGEFGATGEDPEQGFGPTDSPVDMGQMNAEVNPAEGDPIHDQQTREGEEDWQGMANAFLEDNPNMSSNELGALLQQNGASQSTVRGIMEHINPADTGAFQPSASVSYKGKNYKIVRTASTLYGDMLVLSNGFQVMADDDELGEPLMEQKEAAVQVTFDSLMDKTSAFLEEEYAYQESDLNKMASKADSLISELRAYQPDMMSEAVGIQTKIDMLKTAHKVFKEAALKESKETQDYLDSQPQFHVGSVGTGYEFGPGGGDAIHLAAIEMIDEQEALAESWPKVASSVAADIVDQNSELIGSAGDIRRVASRTIDNKFAHLNADEKEEIRTDFVALVEKARRTALREMPKKEARVSDPLPHDYDEGVLL